MLILGSTLNAGFTLALVLINDELRPGCITLANLLLSLAYSLELIMGPLLTGIAVEYRGLGAFSLLMILVSMLLIVPLVYKGHKWKTQ